MNITSLKLSLPKITPKTDYHPNNPGKGEHGFPKKDGRVMCGCGRIHVIGELVERFCSWCGYLVYRKHQLPGTPINYFPKREEV